MADIVNYDIDNDSRFIKNLDKRYVDLLDVHGFPINDLQPKNVHDLGTALGQEYNYYIDQAKELYKQSKLAIATGVGLDNFGLQFGVARDPGEDDETYRLRLQAVFSPKKVTRPHINLVLNQISDVLPAPELFEPWRSVIHFDVTFPYDYTFDTGPWYMWSPNYWRSGTLVIKSGITGNLYGIVEELVNAGIIVLYEQQYASTVDQDEILPDTVSYQRDKVQLGTLVFDRFWCDILQNGSFDDPLSMMDVSDFTLSPSTVVDNITSLTYFTFTNCLDTPVVDPAVWEDAQWELAQWPLVDKLTPGHKYVQDNPWFQFDIIDPGVFLSNENQFQFDFSQSANLDTDPDTSDFDNDTVVVNNDENIMDSTTFVITGWTVVDPCKLDELNYNTFNTYSVQDMALVIEQTPGDYLYIETWVHPDDLVYIADSFSLEVTYVVNFTDSISMSSVVGIEITDSITDSIIFVDLLQPHDILTFTDSVQDFFQTQAFNLGDNVPLGDQRTLSDLPNITLGNAANLTLEQFKIE